MNIQARLHNEKDRHEVYLTTNGAEHSIEIPPRPTGSGSSANGGELLFLALATCYCNDVYREAAREGIEIVSVDVAVEGDFGGIGEPAANVTYRARVNARGANEEAVRALLRHTDTVAEIQNTVRRGVDVRLEVVDVVAENLD